MHVKGTIKEQGKGGTKAMKKGQKNFKSFMLFMVTLWVRIDVARVKMRIWDDLNYLITLLS
jgi:hypothetical protein